MKSFFIMGLIALVSHTSRTRLSANAFQLNAAARRMAVAGHRMSSVDDQGRRVRGGQRSKKNKQWGDDDDDDWGAPSRDNYYDDWGAPSRSSTRRGRGSGNRDDDDDDFGSGSGSVGDSNDGFGGWDDFDVDSYTSPAPMRTRSAPQRRRSDNRGRQGGDGYRGGDRDRRGGRTNSKGGWQRGDRQSKVRAPRQRSDGRNAKEQQKQRSINMNGLEGAGFVHLYGLSSVLNALKAERRDLTTSQEKAEVYPDEEGETAGRDLTPPLPQAQYRPYLFVQDKEITHRRGSKAEQEKQALDLAEQHGIPVTRVDKGILNTLSGNRPHQGMVLRCGKLFFESQSRIPFPVNKSQPKLWLVLDEVVDPQNLGALVRSAYFLGRQKLGVMVCSKNSAPPTPVVSAASAGALEVQTIYSTNNLPRTLQNAVEDGFRIIGASSSVPTARDENPPPLYDLQALPAIGSEDDRPVILVLGSEGHGLRTMVAKTCTEFVRIPSGVAATDDNDEEDEKDVDSLNVSVTGGILLWHLLSGL